MPKILVIEDESFLRELISRKLKNEGFEVLQAVNGEDGIKIAKEQKPELIVLDLYLPGIQGQGVIEARGFRVIEELKKNPLSAKIPIIVLSNYSQKEYIEKALKLGADDFLVKAHFAPSEIVKKIKDILKL